GNVEFVQSVGKTALQIGGAPPRKYEADDLWQLLLVEPEACRQHLLPLLAELSLLGHLAQHSAEVEAALLAQAGADVLPQRQQWQDCVQRLASTSFAERQLADAALRSAGQDVLAFQRQLEPAKLSGEQRSRVRAMLRELPGGAADTPPL